MLSLHLHEVILCTYMSFTYHLYRSYGVLVWEVATFGEPPHEGIQVSELIELASNGLLKLNR